jgi:hypothetical protein
MQRDTNYINFTKLFRCPKYAHKEHKEWWEQHPHLSTKPFQTSQVQEAIPQ